MTLISNNETDSGLTREFYSRPLCDDFDTRISVAEASATYEHPFREYSVTVTDRYVSSDTSHEARLAVRDQLAYVELVLGEGGAEAEVIAEQYRDLLFGQEPTLKAWKKSVPTAKALYPLQRPHARALPDGTPVTEPARLLFEEVMDAVGIRSRADIMTWYLKQHFTSTDKTKLEWASLACGAAVPVVEAAQQLPEKDLSLTLVDWDQDALNFANDLVEGECGNVSSTDIVNMNLVKAVFNGSLQERLGTERYDTVDMLGIFEYLKAPVAQKLLSSAYDMVKPGGVLMLGNMLPSHPQMLFNKHIVQWPGIIPRDKSEIGDIITQSGITSENVDMFISADQVYAVVAIKKPEQTAVNIPQQTRRRLAAHAIDS